ncbi:hypothetical protein KDK_33400 [Dictyobacter kobayashii]|uniref:Uncharacterized protein n=1 Tax=Dictyobacter kobayashii TaxID=2014872 RepID=A0A402AKK2_9CHLR|nr:hypothetical protein KDK_33400 [Dictyobacter kobayashii]
MSQEEKLILYKVLQDIADELRRLEHAAKKEQRKKDQKHTEKEKSETSL